MAFEKINQPLLPPAGSQRPQDKDWSQSSQHQRSWNPSSNINERELQAYCLEKARQLFGLLPKNLVNDPEMFVMGIAAILRDFPLTVIERAADPRVGIAPECKYRIPSPYDTRQWCEREKERLERLSQPPRPRMVIPEFDTKSPGRRANLFVHADAPQYQIAYDWALKADPADWKLDPDGRPGVWVNEYNCKLPISKRIGRFDPQ